MSKLKEILKEIATQKAKKTACQLYDQMQAHKSNQKYKAALKKLSESLDTELLRIDTLEV